MPKAGKYNFWSTNIVVCSEPGGQPTTQAWGLNTYMVCWVTPSYHGALIADRHEDELLQFWL